ncbi:MAG: sigma-70 family RNA polymerase sigma factor [Lachnospiraceae bacterium]
MEKKDLEQYCKLKREVKSLWDRLNKLEHKEIPEVSGKVQASETDFPYLPYGVSVKMYEPKTNDAINKTIGILKKRLEQCNTEMLKVEQFIDRIPDSELRLIFQMRYIDGKKLREVAMELNEDLSGIGKKITAYLKVSNNSKKSVI